MAGGDRKRCHGQDQSEQARRAPSLSRSRPGPEALSRAAPSGGAQGDAPPPELETPCTKTRSSGETEPPSGALRRRPPAKARIAAPAAQESDRPSAARRPSADSQREIQTAARSARAHSIRAPPAAAVSASAGTLLAPPAIPRKRPARGRPTAGARRGGARAQHRAGDRAGRQGAGRLPAAAGERRDQGHDRRRNRRDGAIASAGSPNITWPIPSGRSRRKRR